jgi:hypothetical protein
VFQLELSAATELAVSKGVLLAVHVNGSRLKLRKLWYIKGCSKLGQKLAAPELAFSKGMPFAAILADRRKGHTS